MSEKGALYGVGSFGKIIPIRLKTHTDVTNGLKSLCEENGIKQGAVLLGIGSLRKLTYQVLAPKPEVKMGAGYTDPQELPGPIEIVDMHGIIFQSDEGETLLHLHGTFSDKEGAVFGGHMTAGATRYWPLSMRLSPRFPTSRWSASWTTTSAWVSILRAVPSPRKNNRSLPV